MSGPERGVALLSPLTSISSPFCQSLVSSLHHLKMDGKLQHNSKVRKTWGDMNNLKIVVLKMLETWFSKAHPGS